MIRLRHGDRRRGSPTTINTSLLQYKYCCTYYYNCTVVVSCFGIRVSISCYASPPLPSWIAIPNTTTFTISAPLHSLGFAGNVSVFHHHYALRTTPTPLRLQLSSSVRVRRIGGLVRSCVCSCLSKTFEKHEVVFVCDCEVTCAVRVCVQHKMTTKNIGNNPKFKKWISGFSQEERRHSINNVSKPLRIPTRPDVFNCLYSI